jgi:hypothetical protein
VLLSVTPLSAVDMRTAGVVIACVLNAPGSWHDTRVARPIFEAIKQKVPDGFYLVVDSGFPKGTGEVAGKIVGPLKAGERVPSDKVERATVIEFNQQLLSYRQTAEWGMRTLQGSFARLRVPLQMKDKARRHRFLYTCVRLSNL